MQETLNSKKNGDAAFRAKDFETAIGCYTQVSYISKTTFSVDEKRSTDAIIQVSGKPVSASLQTLHVSA